MFESHLRFSGFEFYRREAFSAFYYPNVRHTRITFSLHQTLTMEDSFWLSPGVLKYLLWNDTAGFATELECKPRAANVGQACGISPPSAREAKNQQNQPHSPPT